LNSPRATPHHEPEPLAARIYARAFAAWSSPRTKRNVASLLAAVFLGAFLLAGLERHGLLPASFPAPRTYFHAVGLVFSCLLFFEAFELVFSIADSTADSLGKQLEIFSIILLRHSFQELSALDEQLGGALLPGLLVRLLADATGALLMFVLTALYYRLQRHRPVTVEENERRSFTAGKKLIALSLLAAGAGLGARGIWSLLHGESGEFFGPFFTLLIFSDILLMLLSLRTSSVFRFVFRNSGYALVTVVLRLGFSAPPLYNAGLGVGAALFAVGLTLAFNFFETQGPRE